ncbi:MAG TPA: histidine kinase [Candidatus Acidoferrales bacterium]|nr:histidine kinase [Candidatus Acidoferrales bacterium]
MNIRLGSLATSVPPKRDRWEAELNLAEPPSARQLLLFVYGTGMAVGLHLALIHLYLWRSPAAFALFLVATLLFSTLTLALWHWVMPRLADRSFASRLTWQVLISIGAFALLSFIIVEGNAFLFGGRSMLRPYDGPDVTINITSLAIRRAPLVYFLIPIIPTAVLCVVGFNLHWWRIFVLQGRARELRELAVSAQLAALRAQVNPHFFFNSLNSIAQLISTDPVKAEACVERLADIFRYMLTRSQAEFVRVSDELEFAEAYLDIERARFGDELVVNSEIDEQARGMMMPGLLLQPLIENAVKHGISAKIGGGEVLIRAAVQDGDLCLTVRDSGVGIQAQDSVFERGVGLRNVRDRLVRLYGPSYAPTIDSTDGNGTTVSLRIPAPSMPKQRAYA